MSEKMLVMFMSVGSGSGLGLLWSINNPLADSVVVGVISWLLAIILVVQLEGSCGREGTRTR